MDNLRDLITHVLKIKSYNICPSNGLMCLIVAIIMFYSGMYFDLQSATNMSFSRTIDTSFRSVESAQGVAERIDIAEEVKCLREENVSSFRSRLKTIWVCLCIVVSLVLCYGILLYRYNDGKRDIRGYQQRAETMKDRYESMYREKIELERTLEEQERLDSLIKRAVNNRLTMLDGLIASEISGNTSYASAYKGLVDAIHRNPSEFVESAKRIYYDSYPQFWKYIDSADLDEKEKSIICLYGLGLRGKEIGQYIRMGSFYNTCSTIRKKLGVNEHDTNLGLYVRKLMVELS